MQINVLKKIKICCLMSTFFLSSCSFLQPSNSNNYSECNHQLSYHKEVESTCTTKGTKLYYSCDICKKIFSDIEAKNEIIKASDLVIQMKEHDYEFHKSKQSNCTVQGNIEYYQCKSCQQLFKNLEGELLETSPVLPTNNNHDYVEPTYSFSDDLLTCTAKSCCSYDINHNHDIIEIVNCENETIDDEIYSVAKFKNVNFKTQKMLKSVTTTLIQDDKTNLSFKGNKNVKYYKVFDDNDFNDSHNKIFYTSKTGDNNFSYQVTYVGNHNIYVEGYDEKDNVITISNTISTYIEPIYFYQTFNTVYYFSRKEAADMGISCINSATHYSGEIGSDDEVLLFYIDSNYNWTSNKTLRITTFGNDYLDLIKEAGANVIMLENLSGMVKVGERSFDNSEVKKYLDYAYSIGLKVIVSNERELIIFQNDPVENYNTFLTKYGSQLNADFGNAIMKTVLQHDACYGLFIGDEPRYEKLEFVGYIIKWIKNYINTNNLKMPRIICDLLYFANSIFDSEQDFINYISKWIEVTGLDYFAFDAYTHNANGANSKSSSHKRDFTAINKYRAINKNVKVHQTITANRSNSNSASLTYKDIFSQMYLSLSQCYDGLSWFSFLPIFSGGWRYGVVSPSNSEGIVKSSHFNYIKEASKQYEELKCILNNYTFESCEITFEKQSVLSSKYIKKMISTLKNGSSAAIFVVNYGTTDGVDIKYKVQNNAKYLYCTKDGIIEKTGDGNNVTLSNGEALLVI